ncbi:MAG: Fe-S-cluster-containing hydrogenase component 2/CRP-like cAMP-binding protein/thioredoxin reductase [Halieaceae bacterium]|jgi:Fe-S-cluster-containing hydrogenase component 2/CRP-like cAMP-binding protein/thioredoxin reductase
MNQYAVVIIGSGPAGLSAAARAEHFDREENRQSPSYVLLEGHDTFAKTIQKYQKGKHVMAEPGFLNLRSPMPFIAGRREVILDAWSSTLTERDINIRYDAEVIDLSGSKNSFVLTLRDGSSVEAMHVVLAIGTQGNPRSLGVPGDDHPDFVLYSLDDADAYRERHIVVVGAGDAAIENAIALAQGNQVTIVNRRSEFSRAKDGNLSAILEAINDSDTPLDCRYESSVAALELPAGDQQGAILLNTPTGKQRLPCDLVIARLGAVPPRAFVESCGISFGSSSVEALPDVDRHYESNVEGLYIIGALGGYPLIKQAMNQGYEVIDFINGRDTRPADYELLETQFGGLPYVLDPEDVLALYQSRIPMFRYMNALVFRELIIESRILLAEEERTQATGKTVSYPTEHGAERKTQSVRPGHILYRDGDYSSSFYTLVEGAARLQLELDGPWYDVSPGQFFGEMSLISGRPRQGSAVILGDSILIETPRRIMVKLMAGNEDIRGGIDRIFVVRALLAAFRTELGFEELLELSGRIERRTLEAGEVLYREGEEGEELYLIRRGRIALSRGDDNHVVNQLQSGELAGQQAMMGASRRRDTATAAVRTEALAIRQEEFLALVSRSNDYLGVLQERLSENLSRSNAISARSDASETMNFLIGQGMGEATNALLIDENLCIGCDNCERACAETHGGISRVQRRGKRSHNGWHVAQTCMHCELPHCMKDCPTDAIRRSRDGEVFITDACIGCGNCESNCPYDAISMRYPASPKPGLLSWFLFGRGPGPGDNPGSPTESIATDESAKKVAVKCDACREMNGEYACVRACPTGAAIRVGAEEFIDLVKVL